MAIAPLRNQVPEKQDVVLYAVPGALDAEDQKRISQWQERCSSFRDTVALSPRSWKDTSMAAQNYPEPLTGGGSAFLMKAQRPCRVLVLLVVLSSQACNRTHGSIPEIVGTVQYSNQVYQAVRLLEERDIQAYQIVTNYVGRIQEGPRSGMWADRIPPTYEMSDATAFYSVTWCAATIAHDSFHSKLYHDYQKAHGVPVPNSIWIGPAAEQQCMKHQLSVMEHIGASKWERDYAKTQADGHYAKDKETWEEYRKRAW